MKHIKKIHWNVLFVVLFLVFMGIFSFYRAMIADQAVWLLAMTREVSFSNVRKGSGESGSAALKIVTDQKLKSITKGNKAAQSKAAAKKQSDMLKHPVTADLPKTKIPEIPFLQYSPEWDNPKLTLFDPLRKYDGTAWNKEKTEIKGATNGKMLFLICRFYEKDPYSAIVENTAGKNNNPWKDDSIELFLMKDRQSSYYCQYVVSVSGKGSINYYKNGDNPKSASSQKLPSGFVRPRCKVNELDGYYEIEMSIDLSNIGISNLEPGESFLMQVVRNYRGQGYKDSVLLHLFPVYIYADKRLGASNHDRRTFQKVIAKK
jgi:hypothetical protein